MIEQLDTDRLNFLIWRYLLECNYRQTAAKLQQEWRVKAPHRDFDWAKHVTAYALVSLLKKGLKLEEYEREVYSNLPTTKPPKGVFGPLVFEPPFVEEDAADQDLPESEVELQEPLENPRKRPVERQHHAPSNASPAKRQRVSMGDYESAADAATTPMDLDHQVDSNNINNSNNHAYPSPLEGEQAASPPPRTQGPDQGTQVPKVDDLTQQTVFLRLGADHAVEGAEPSPAPASENPMVLAAEWNPTDPSILAAGGTDALARIWTLPRGAAPENSPSDHVDSVTRPYQNLLGGDASANATVSAVAWNSPGTSLAMAFENGPRAMVSITGRNGTLATRFDGLESPVIKLRWGPDHEHVLGISPDNGGTLVTIFSATTSESRSYTLAENNLRENILDAAWINENEFVLCGGSMLISLKCSDQGIVPGRVFQTSDTDLFTHVQFDWRSKLLATASSEGTIDLWDGLSRRRTIRAHIGAVNALQWQPLKTEPTEDERLLASAGDDGAICIWNVQNLDNEPNNTAKFTMTMEDPVLSLSISPDGAFVAGATAEKVLVWKVGDTTWPRATWNRTPHRGWQSPKHEAEEDIEPCLGWDAEGQRLVYGLNSRLAVISFR